MADKLRYAWFDSVHLWQFYEEVSWDTARSDSPEHAGVTRQLATASPGSPNFKRNVRVRCRIGPATASGSLDGGDITELQALTTDNSLLAKGKALYTLKVTYHHAGGALHWSLASCLYVGMSLDPPSGYDAPQIRYATYAFVGYGALTIVPSLSSFAVASL